MVIAEGDIVVLCIRLFSELLLGRYRLPLPSPSDSSLAHLANSIMDEHVRGAAALPGGHRGAEAEYYILPQAENAIVAMGHAMAYAAARDSGRVPAPLLAVYEAGVVRDYSAWFTEVGGVPIATQRQREADALRAAVPDLLQYAKDLGIEPYIRASIVDDSTWERTLQQLVTYTNSGSGLVYSSSATDFEGMQARL